VTVRPEKIHLLAAGASTPEGAHAEQGTVEDVIYLGMLTRFVVSLDAGGTVVAVRQNLETHAEDVATFRGQRVVVAWQPEQAYEIQAVGS
jgi:putative spermidine/putrescine transport system ATP-binding protein